MTISLASSKRLDLVRNFGRKNLGYMPKNLARSSSQISKYLAKTVIAKCEYHMANQRISCLKWAKK